MLLQKHALAGFAGVLLCPLLNRSNDPLIVIVRHMGVNFASNIFTRAALARFTKRTTHPFSFFQKF
jgi:hypothetical protein